MRRLPGRTKLFIGSWYIGAGNKPSVISQNSNKAFSKIRELYKDELRVKGGQNNSWQKVKFTEKDREKIRLAISKRYRSQMIWKICIVLVSAALTIGVLMFLAFQIKTRIQESYL